MRRLECPSKNVISPNPVIATDALTYCCDDGGREEQSARELPLRAEPIRHELDDVGGNLLVLGLVDLVFVSQLQFLGLEPLTLRDLVLRLQRVENGGADQQVSESADDKRQSSDVLPLHRKPTTQQAQLHLS